MEITICTNKYIKTLRKFLSAAACPFVESGGGFAVNVRATDRAAFVYAFAKFLQSLTLYENPIVRNSARLRMSVARAVFPKNAVRKELRRFLSENAYLNLDGYMTFAMRDYAEKINLVLYSAVRKNFDKLYELTM